MRTRFTRLDIEGFRSLRAVVPHPEPLEVFLDPQGTATRDLIRGFRVQPAGSFDLQDVQRVETSDGASSFRPLMARKEPDG